MIGGLAARGAAQEPGDTSFVFRYRGPPPRLSPIIIPPVLLNPWFTRWQVVGVSPLLMPSSPPERVKYPVPHDSVARDRLLRRLGYSGGVRGGGTVERSLLGVSSSTAEVTLDGDLQVDISTSRQRALNCTPVMLQSLYSGCRGSFGAPKLENLLILQSQGVFGRRLHVDIDLNTGRSYANNNVIRAYYQGLEDEIVQRIEAGSVTFRAPSSRYLGASIPINNRGIATDLQLGPISLQAIAARQEGSTADERILTIGSETSSPQDRKVADLDFEEGRFFWIVNPTSIPGFPALDILSLENVVVPDDQRPAEVQVYRYIAANQPGTAGATYEGGITARAVNGTETFGPVRWRALQQGIDYWLDPSGLWFVLSNSIDPNDLLAVSYRTRAGTLVGTMPTADHPELGDILRLITAPNRGPASPLFPYAMRQIYRIGGDIVRSSLQVSIEVAQSERPASGASTYLALLGLAVPSDQAIFDTDNRLFPRTRDAGASIVVRDQLIIFPHARPFADATKLSPAELNDSLYRTPGYLLATQGPPTKFKLGLRYDARSTGDKSGFVLGEIRAESERITANGRRLVRDVDYRIAYETGQVSFLHPNELFPGSASVTIRAQFERQAVFAVAPTSIQGLTATWGLGRRGNVSVVGLYQSEESAYRRPPVGSEPKAGFIGGFTSTLNFDLPRLTNALSRISRQSVGAPSSFGINAEMAFSRPDPNRYGEAFLEEFENDGGNIIEMAETNWLPGSSPQRPDGVEAIGFAAGFQLADAVQLTWQNLVTSRGSIFEVTPQEIDTTIRVTDSRNRQLETVLWTTLHADTAGGVVDSVRHSHWTQPHTPSRPRWRSMTTPLSSVGIDLSQSEYLEFWLYQAGDPIQQAGMQFVIDIGKVSEDAVTLAPTNFTVSGNDTTWTGRQYTGLGRMDTERTPLGTWNAQTDDNGILGDRPDSVIGPGGEIYRFKPICLSPQIDGVAAFPFGDLSSRCTNSNGILDTEDLDGDGVLDAFGSSDDVQRYVVDIRDRARYFVRDRIVDSGTVQARWSLYRVPLRNPDHLIGQPDLRLTKQMRITFVTPPGAGGIDPTLRFGLARMRLTGAPWIRRADRPILGISGATAESHGSVLVGSISTQNIELGYTSPPGLNNSLNEISGVAQEGVQINEKSLRITARDLQGGERAEAYHRLFGGTQNLLAYRQLRVWMRGHGPGWDNHELEAYIKVASDASNFYFYHLPISTTSWDPDVVVELERWQALRADIEARFLRGEPASGAAECGGDPTAWIACDGPYFVQVRDPQINPPNLAAVQELATGIWRPGQGAAISETELWVDDIRVREPIAETGTASAISARLVASDIATFDVDWTSRDGRFRQLGEIPSYLTQSAARMAGSLRLDHLVPTFGFEIPIAFSRNTSGYDPQLLRGTDIRGDALAGLRRAHSESNNWSFGIRRRLGYSTTSLARLVLDPLSFSASGGNAESMTELSTANTTQFNANLGYLRTASRLGRNLGLRGIVGVLPRWIRESEAGRTIGGETFAPLPTTLRFSSTISKSVGDFLTYKAPIERLSDTILRPQSSIQHLWSNTAGVTWQPLTMVTGTLDWRSTRDLRHYSDSSSIGRLAELSRRELLGTDVGVERDRSVTSILNVTPRINSWIRPSFTTVSNFFLSRSLTSRNPVRILGDTAGGYILPQTLNNSRNTRTAIDFDPLNLVRRLLGDSSGLADALSRLRPFTLSHTHTLTSTYDLAAFDPGFSFQLGRGNLQTFLNRNGERAVGAGEMWNNEINTELDLPGGLLVSARYISSESDQYQRLSGSGFLRTNNRQVTWPSGDFHWRTRLPKGPVVDLQLGAQVERQFALSRTPIANNQFARSGTTTEMFRPNASLTFRNGVNLTVSTTRDRAITEGSSNISRRSGDMLDASLNATIRMPRSISRLRRSLFTTVSMTQRADHSCLQQAEETECATFSDLKITDFSGSFSAVLSGAGHRVGAQFSRSLEDNRSLRRQVSRISMRVYFRLPLNFLGS